MPYMNTALHMPPVFVSHGSPMVALQPREAGAFMQTLGHVLRQQYGTPKAILIASAHTLARQPVLLGAAQHHAVYDFGGFDPQLHTLRYDAPGAPALATRAAALLSATGLTAHVDAHNAGLDHGIWTALRYVFPDADVPVLPLAWPPNWQPAQLMALGQALAPLAAEGVWVLGSGSITHNLQRVFADVAKTGEMPAVDAPATPESTAFRDWFAQQGAAANWPALQNYRSLAPHGVLMHPSDEHLLPFYVAAGAAQTSSMSKNDDTPPALRVHASLTYGDLGMDAYAFGPGAAALQSALKAAGAV
jgi:4,5-DOPA dioxygenase extradiol